MLWGSARHWQRSQRFRRISLWYKGRTSWSFFTFCKNKARNTEKNAFVTDNNNAWQQLLKQLHKISVSNMQIPNATVFGSLQVRSQTQFWMHYCLIWLRKKNSRVSSFSIGIKCGYLLKQQHTCFTLDPPFGFVTGSLYQSLQYIAHHRIKALLICSS